MILTGWWWFWFGSYHLLLWLGLAVGLIALVFAPATIIYVVLILIPSRRATSKKRQSRNISHALP